MLSYEETMQAHAPTFINIIADLCRVSTIPLPFPYTPLLLPLPLPLRHSSLWLVGVDDWLATYGTTATEKQKSVLFQRLRQLLPFTAVTERNFLT